MSMYMSSFFLKMPMMFVVLVYLLNMHVPSIQYLFLAIVNAFLAINEFFSDEDRPYTLHKIVNFFILFFFVLANAIQFSTNRIVTSLCVAFDENDYIFFQLLVLVIVFLFNLLYHYFVGVNVEFRIPLKEKEIIDTKKIILLSSVAFALVLLFYSDQISKLFFRGFVENINVESHASSGDLIFGKFIRSIPFACFFIALVKKTPKWCIILLFFETLVTVFPLGLARNAAAMYWLPIMISIFRFLNKRYFFCLFLFLALLIIFPFLDNFRYFDGRISFSSINLGYLNTMNFDASQEFMALLNYDIITYGWQLLGVLFFWLPRSIWLSKPVGSGSLLAQNQHVFENISMPFFAEGFINFGYVGIFVFIIALAFFCALFDNSFWNNKMYFMKHSWCGIYLILLGSFLFIMRGDLLSSFAYTTGIILAYLFSKKLCISNSRI